MYFVLSCPMFGSSCVNKRYLSHKLINYESLTIFTELKETSFNDETLLLETGMTDGLYGQCRWEARLLFILCHTFLFLLLCV